MPGTQRNKDGKPTRRVSHKGAKQKGNRGETEFVDICRERGLPSMRVLGSGAMKSIGAAADVKVGITNMYGDEYPASDESASVMRVEVKNRASNPEWIHPTKEQIPFAFIASPKLGNEQIWAYYNQDKVTKAIVLRRAKVPAGSIVNKDYNQVGMVCLGYDSFIDLVKRAYGTELGVIHGDLDV